LNAPPRRKKRDEDEEEKINAAKKMGAKKRTIDPFDSCVPEWIIYLWGMLW
jgi:hypothetical protein